MKGSCSPVGAVSGRTGCLGRTGGQEEQAVLKVSGVRFSRLPHHASKHLFKGCGWCPSKVAKVPDHRQGACRRERAGALPGI